MTREQLLQALLALPERARAEIADELLASLAPPDPRTEEEWAAEIERRIREIDDGTAVLVDWEDARKRILDDSDE